MNEIWKDIPGYEGLYQVSNMGRVKSFKIKYYEKILKGRKNSVGYYQVALSKNNKCKSFYIHQLVILTFMGKPLSEKYCEVNHIDEDKANNKLENLQYCLHVYNCNYGTRNERGSKNRSKPIIGINKTNGYIAEFNSIAEAGRVTGIQKTDISTCCKGKLKSAGGYIWMYKNEVDKEVK